MQKLLLYAPGNDDGRQQMSNILQSLNMHKEWTLVPMISDSYDGLTANDLGEKLKDGLLKARHNLQIETSSGGVIGDDYQEAGVVFLGMDSPEVYLDEIEGSLIEAASPARVTHLCPANDGGYGMICLPSSAPASVFDGVRWSDPLTAISQMKALSDCDITNIRIGRLMYDIDEPEDVYGLAGRLCTYFNKSNQDGNEKDWHTSMHAGDALSRPSFAVQISACTSTCCKHTWETLLRLKIVKGEKHNFRMSGTIREFLLHKEG